MCLSDLSSANPLNLQKTIFPTLLMKAGRNPLRHSPTLFYQHISTTPVFIYFIHSQWKNVLLVWRKCSSWNTAGVELLFHGSRGILYIYSGHNYNDSLTPLLIFLTHWFFLISISLFIFLSSKTILCAPTTIQFFSSNFWEESSEPPYIPLFSDNQLSFIILSFEDERNTQQS